MSRKPEHMTDKTTYEKPEVIESLDEVEVFGESPANPTLAAGSSTVPHEI